MSELWNGFAMENFSFEGREAHVVFPREGTANGRLMLKTVYWGAFPDAVEVPPAGAGIPSVLCEIRIPVGAG